MKTIPESFESVDHYLSSYVYPLLEETRAELASALEVAYKAPFAEIKHFNESKREKLLYSVKVDYWINSRSDSGKEPYRTLPDDFVLLSDSKPERLSDLESADFTYTFASVRSISGDGSDGNCAFGSSDFELTTAGSIDVEDKRSKSLYVVYLMNMTTNKRMWRALKMRRNLKIIEKVLTMNESVCHTWFILLVLFSLVFFFSNLYLYCP